MIRVIAVDDEPLALRQLESYISKVPYFELVASCSGALQAREVLLEKEVDAMFLDINMPDLSGMELVRMLDSPPLVVFTTAYSEYAVEGYKVDAVDYLLKPFGLGDFLKAAEKVRARCGDGQETAAPRQAVASGQDALFFRTDYKTVRVRLDEIRYIESMSEYVKVYTDAGPAPLIVLLSLKHLVEQLPPDRFMRIHRSCIIPLGRIREVGKSEVLLDDGTRLPVGDLYRQELKDYLNKFSLG